jgi:hypothetical protein
MRGSKNIGQYAAINASPEFGYAIRDNLLLGSKLSFDYYSNQRRNLVWYPGVYIEKFFPLYNDKLGLSLQPSITTAIYNGDIDNLNANARLSIFYFIMPRLNIKANITQIGYNYYNRSGISSVYMDLNPRFLNISFSYFFGSKMIVKESHLKKQKPARE